MFLKLAKRILWALPLMAALVLWALPLLAALAMASSTPARAGEPEEIVNRAVAALAQLRSDSNFAERIEKLLPRAKGVLIVPDLVRGGFLLGAEYGGGVLLASDGQGSWSSPAFYTVAGGSLGLQLGLQESETIFLLMTDKGLDAVMKNKFTADAGVSVAFGTRGAGAQASTTAAFGADVVALSRTAGAFGGGSLGGTAILPRDTWNRAYYGSDIEPDAIVIKRAVSNPQADALRSALGGR